MILKSKTVTKTQTIKETFCDVCKKNTGRCYRQCEGCRKDLCNSCIVWWETDPWTEADNGDYPDTVCKECDDKSKPIVEQVEKISYEAFEKIGQLKQDWERLCNPPSK